MFGYNVKLKHKTGPSVGLFENFNGILKIIDTQVNTGMQSTSRRVNFIMIRICK